MSTVKQLNDIKEKKQQQQKQQKQQLDKKNDIEKERLRQHNIAIDIVKHDDNVRRLRGRMVLLQVEGGGDDENLGGDDDDNDGNDKDNDIVSTIVVPSIVKSNIITSSSTNTTTTTTQKIICPYLPTIIGDEIPLDWKRGGNSSDRSSDRSSDQQQQELMGSDNNNINNINDNDRRRNRHQCVSTRGFINVEPLATIVKEGYCKVHQRKSTTNKISSMIDLWDPINASKSNVSIMRPSHDAWGIGKIVLVFCDDFLSKVYEMPWWHMANKDNDDNNDPNNNYNNDITTQPNLMNTIHKLRSSIQPILTTLSIKPHQIVRLLLASLPPNSTIPVHHDTGDWVPRTHRVHVPIIVPQNHDNNDVQEGQQNNNVQEEPQAVVEDPILFQCGPTEDNMGRVRCIPGHVFEMNNSLKHAVSNTHSTLSRVHLILDYMDDVHDDDDMNNDNNNNRSIIERIKLNPGEVVVQTRRSIDRKIDAGKRPVPSFMILGAQKCGTTSLYHYLIQHPLIARAKVRETHCLDWRWNENKEDDRNIDDDFSDKAFKGMKLKRCLSFFNFNELHHRPSCLTGESTPSYLLDSLRVVPRLKHIFPHSHIAGDGAVEMMKFLVILRNPVHRTKSHYEMVTSVSGTSEQLKNRGSEWRGIPLKQVVHTEMELLMKCGLVPGWDLDTGRWSDMSRTSDFFGSAREDKAFEEYLRNHVPLRTGSHSLVIRGMYELQLRRWFNSGIPRESFLVLKLEDMTVPQLAPPSPMFNSVNSNNGFNTIEIRQRNTHTSITKESNVNNNYDDIEAKGGVQHTMDRVCDHLKIPRCTVEDATPRNTRKYKPLVESGSKSAEDKDNSKDNGGIKCNNNDDDDDDGKLGEMLSRFFEPYNARLEILLGKLWSEPWPIPSQKR